MNNTAFNKERDYIFEKEKKHDFEINFWKTQKNNIKVPKIKENLSWIDNET